CFFSHSRCRKYSCKLFFKRLYRIWKRHLTGRRIQDGSKILKGRSRFGGEMLKSFSNQTELGFTTPKRTHGTFQHSLPAEGGFVFIIIEAAAFCYANQFFTSFPTVLYAG